MSNIIIVSTKRKVVTLTAVAKTIGEVCSILDGKVAELLEKDPEARPLFPTHDHDGNEVYFILSQQWTYTERTET